MVGGSLTCSLVRWSPRYGGRVGGQEELKLPCPNLYIPCTSRREEGADASVSKSVYTLHVSQRGEGWHVCYFYPFPLFPTELCSYMFWETHSLRRIMQIVECRPKAESPLSQRPQPLFVKTLYTLSVCAQTYLSKFSETSLNKGKERYSQI